MLLDIVVLPPGRLRASLGAAICRAAAGSDPLLVVDNRTLIPHVSLFHIRTSKIRAPESRIGEVVERHRQFELRSRGPEATGNWVGIRIGKNRAFVGLQQDIVRRCRRLRTGTMPFTASRPPTKLEREYRRTYGTQHVFRLTHPHITLARFNDPTAANRIADRLTDVRFRFRAGTVALTEVNVWHQVTGIRNEYQLAGARRSR